MADNSTTMQIQCADCGEEYPVTEAGPEQHQDGCPTRTKLVDHTIDDSRLERTLAARGANSRFERFAASFESVSQVEHYRAVGETSQNDEGGVVSETRLLRVETTTAGMNFGPIRDERGWSFRVEDAYVAQRTGRVVFLLRLSEQ